jgi:enamine deaminase RidA (YjgF/YER057c/UK114 family)
MSSAGAERKNYGSGAVWEDIVGYSRVVRTGPHVHVAGTTAPGADAGSQTRAILERVQQALRQAGADMRHVVRTRMFVTDISQWEAIAAVHAEFFRDVRPVATMVEVRRLISPELLVEIEVDAYVGE